MSLYPREHPIRFTLHNAQNEPSLLVSNSTAEPESKILLKLGSKGQEVLLLQKALVDFGFDPGKPDGSFGKNTASAVVEWQKEVHLKADGVFGPGSLEKWNLYCDKKNLPHYKFKTNDAPTTPVVSDPQSQVMYLELVNRKDEPLTIKRNATFVLIFRKGLLVNEAAIACKTPRGWNWKENTLSTTQTITLAEGKAVRFELSKVVVDRDFAAQSTRVELRYTLPLGEQITKIALKTPVLNPLKPAKIGQGFNLPRGLVQNQPKPKPKPGAIENAATLEGFCLQHLAVVRHLGQKLLPVHVGIVGSRTILNNGNTNTNNTIRLRITNTGRDPLKFNPDSQFVFSFDVDPTQNMSVEWALGRKDQVKGVSVKLANGTDAHKDDQGEVPSWTTAPFTTPSALATGQHVDFVFSNFTTAHPSGETNLYINYRSVPGYWDGQFVVALQKAPLLFMGDNVGVGTPTPNAMFEVTGAIMPSSGASESRGILFTKNPGGGSGDAAWLRYYARSGEACTLEMGTSNDANDHIALMPSGNVGIGTNAPRHKLHVVGTSYFKGNVKFDSGFNAVGDSSLKASGGRAFQFVSKAGEPVVEVWGNSWAKLQVMGGMSVSGKAVINGGVDVIGDGSLRASGGRAFQFVSKNGEPVVEVWGKENHTQLFVMGHAAKKDGGSSWSIISDERLKQDVTPFTHGLESVLSLNPIRFRYLDDQALGLTSDNEHIGFVAQEVKKSIPEAVMGSEEGGEYLSLSADPIHWAAINAIKELHALLVEKEEKIGMLKERLVKLEQTAEQEE